MRKDLTGYRFGRLVVISQVEKTSDMKEYWWYCKCDCGNYKNIRGSCLNSGRTTSCSCLSKEIARGLLFKHGYRETKIYKVWQNMIGRCEIKSHMAYKNYGGRGIKVCERWRNSFKNFLSIFYDLVI